MTTQQVIQIALQGGVIHPEVKDKGFRAYLDSITKGIVKVQGKMSIKPDFTLKALESCYKLCVKPRLS